MAYSSRFFMTIVASLVFAFALAACSGGDGADTSSDPTATPRATPTSSVSSVDTSRAPAAPTPSAPTPLPEPSPSPTPDILAGPVGQEGLVGPELTGISTYINTNPFTLRELQGEKVVLIDFWTYTCINCIRTLPFIKEWHEKYKDAGLVIVGVHAPEFEFEKVEDNVRMAVEEWGIEYPVVMDNDHGTWNAFLNQSWPAKYLIDKDGVIRYTHFGEGGYTETEDEIRTVLAELGGDVNGIAHGNIEDPDFHLDALAEDAMDGLTRELYAGVNRNYGALSYGGTPYVLHEEFYSGPDQELVYDDTDVEYLNQFIYLKGAWLNEFENLRHARTTENYEDYILVNFKAAEVNVVLTADGAYEVRVLVDDEPVKPEQAGLDIQWDDEGNSFVTVDEPRMYRIIQLDDFESHELKLTSNSDLFSVFAYTFGAYIGAQPLP
jgi:thiol-disulfide isomerase/thioredoxin